MSDAFKAYLDARGKLLVACVAGTGAEFTPAEQQEVLRAAYAVRSASSAHTAEVLRSVGFKSGFWTDAEVVAAVERKLWGEKNL